MHPWITADHPDNCTICGMALVQTSKRNTDASSENIVPLSATNARVIGLTTATVEPRDLTREVRVSGIIEDDERRHRVIAAHYEGRIENVYVDHVGQTIKRGEPLASIYSPELLYIVREYQVTARKNPNDAAALNAKRRLLQFGLFSEQIDALAKESKEIYDIEILSPMDGTLLVRDVYAGQYVKTGEMLFEMGELSTMWFHGEVYEQDLAAIRLGQRVKVASPAAPGRSVEGLVTFIDPTFNAVNRSTLVRIEISNPVISQDHNQQRRLFPHRAYAEGLIAANYGSVLSVPRTAVLNDGRRSIAYVELGEGKYEPREVKTGIVGDQNIQILEGLREGENVVTEGNLILDAEAQIRGGGVSAPPLPAASVASADLEISAKQAAALAEEDLPAFLQALPSNTPASENLADARKQFLPLANAAAKEALASKNTNFTVFECPMTESSFPGAPASARWIQPRGTEMKNPYLGKDMQFCGLEVKP